MRKHSWTVLLPSLVLALLPAASSAAEPDKPNKTTMLSAYVGPSIMYVQVTYEATVYDPYNKQYVPTKPDGREPKVFTRTAACTGFVVNPNGYISTAGHCVDPKEQNDGFIIDAAQWSLESEYLADTTVGGDATTVESLVKDQGFYVKSATEDRRTADRASIDVAWGTEKDQQFRARLINYQRAAKGDAALLKIDANKLLAVKLADSSDLEVGTEVVSIGYPGKVDQAVDDDFNPSYKDGEISSRKTQDGGLFSVFEVSSALTFGMSGGPTATLDGDVVGFNSFIALDDADGSPSEQFGFIGTSDRILERMADAGVKNDIGPLGRQYKAGLDAYFANDKDKAIENLQAVVDGAREHTTAQTYLDRAKKLPDPFPIALVAALSAVGLLLVAGLVFFLVQRRKGGPGGPGGSPSDAAATPSTPAATASPEPTTPQPVTTSTIVAEPVEPSTRSSGFQVPTARVEPTVETPDPTAPAPTPSAQYCSSCGSQIGPTAKFCPSCGTPVQS